MRRFDVATHKSRVVCRTCVVVLLASCGSSSRPASVPTTTATTDTTFSFVVMIASIADSTEIGRRDHVNRIAEACGVAKTNIRYTYTTSFLGFNAVIPKSVAARCAADTRVRSVTRDGAARVPE